MKQEFEKLAAAGKIEGRHVEPLTQLVEGGCCSHRSWGFGKIKTVDTVFARFTIDFPGKAGHTMDLSFAAESAQADPEGSHPRAQSGGHRKRPTDGRASFGFDQTGFEQFWRKSDGGSNPAGSYAGRDPRRLEKMVGNGQARNEKGRPFHRAVEKNRAGRFSGAGNHVAGSFARGFSRGERFEGARRGRRGNSQGRFGLEGQGGGGGRNHFRAERGHRVAPAHAAGGRAGGDFCARRIAPRRRTSAG